MNSEFIVKVRKALRNPFPVSESAIIAIEKGRVELLKNIEQTILKNSVIGQRQLVHNYEEVRKELIYGDVKVMTQLTEWKEEGLDEYDAGFSNTKDLLHSMQDALGFMVELGKIYFPELVFEEFKPAHIIKMEQEIKQRK